MIRVENHQGGKSIRVEISYLPQCLAIVMRNGARVVGINLFRKDLNIEYFWEKMPECCYNNGLVFQDSPSTARSVKNFKNFLVGLFTYLNVLETWIFEKNLKAIEYFWEKMLECCYNNGLVFLGFTKVCQLCQILLSLGIIVMYLGVF